jgi:hypothetical protein
LAQGKGIEIDRTAKFDDLNAELADRPAQPARGDVEVGGDLI